MSRPITLRIGSNAPPISQQLQQVQIDAHLESAKATAIAFERQLREIERVAAEHDDAAASTVIALGERTG